mmetsp:Transcript_4709/g.6705  ORF Transcript_4709/g.6705 Transcript_4709/m.6705 type:complete len:176 (-) Transcript_4709:862-1389(-)
MNNTSNYLSNNHQDTGYNDSNYNQMHEELLRDQTKTLLQRESDYLASVSLSVPSSINSNRCHLRQHGQWRSKICEWCYRVIDHFQYDRKVVSIAIDYFDRFLMAHPGADSMSSRNYQLAAMTSLYIAMKIHADDPEDMSMADMNTSTSTSTSTESQSHDHQHRHQHLNNNNNNNN